ncbi:2-(3-amino-3-carboxypropyl)histidine synthase subunit 2-like [Babylonia areolata]|uniref:2-(3-amino-3-carboxypropyl)histidine synthase subunit 2-like n=1 Tax=Babylonia areolata TaxID=304850 RepID=UPI003FD58647
MTSKSAFSSEDDVTTKRIESVSKPTGADKLQEVYEFDRCCRWIQENGFSKVALQFPDERLVDSVPVQCKLQGAVPPNAAVFILGDTSYGSCCVDEVAAEHYRADSLIHFGPTCLSPTQRLPVLHVFCSQPVDVGDAARQVDSLCRVAEAEACRLIVVADTVYQHAVEPLVECFKAAGIETVASYPQLPSSCSSTHTDRTNSSPCSRNCSQNFEASDTDSKNETEFCWHCRCNRRFALPAGSSMENYSVCYIGEEGKVLTNLMMTMNKCSFLSYNPETRIARRETLNVNRELMKRYFMIEQAKEAKIVGIMAGTLGVSRTCEIIAHLKAVVKGAGKKSYTFVVGKLNVPKLANFMEVDVFVLVACPLNTLIDSKEFLKPVVTPFEMEIACNQAREWTGDYVTDFLQLLPGASEHVPLVAAEPDTADVSLISNRLVSLGQRSALDGEEESSAVTLRSDTMALTSVRADTASEFLSSRSWQGLDRQLGQTAVEKAKDGRSGIAMGYQNEPQ